MKIKTDETPPLRIRNKTGKNLKNKDNTVDSIKCIKQLPTEYSMS